VKVAPHHDAVGERLEAQHDLDGLGGNEPQVVDAEIADRERRLDDALGPRAMQQFDSVQAQW
jgi:hypothetical protein